ncbi:MAG: Hsp20/alpha crystallin family protein, partial [Armatimonadetes bacterium]|nr:Hsp20/alpha crystallin family protein [Armatimonadota bacterium]
NRGWNPAIDVYEDAESLQFHVELPGLKPEEIDVELKGDTLTIKGERKFENEEKKSGYVRVERAYGKFQRSFTLGVPINADGLKATCKNGVLEVIVPKAEAIKPKKALVTAE